MKTRLPRYLRLPRPEIFLLVQKAARQHQLRDFDDGIVQIVGFFGPFPMVGHLVFRTIRTVGDPPIRSRRYYRFRVSTAGVVTLDRCDSPNWKQWIPDAWKSDLPQKLVDRLFRRRIGVVKPVIMPAKKQRKCLRIEEAETLPPWHPSRVMLGLDEACLFLRAIYDVKVRRAGVLKWAKDGVEVDGTRIYLRITRTPADQRWRVRKEDLVAFIEAGS